MLNKKLEKLSLLLAKKNYRLAVAESCTGGLLGAKITGLPGSSHYFSGGVIAYSNRIKTSLLGVEEKLLISHGAVSKEVAERMATGVRERFGVPFSISTTGIAGPGGGSEEKPVGLVYIGVSSPTGNEVVKNNFTGNRHQVREKTVNAALILAINNLTHSS
ncbi:MAG: CinA family protein [bacterium]